jgi:hypothetical protein
MLIAVLLLAQAAQAQSLPLHDQIRETYSFQPHLLNSQQIQEKAAVLDRFWDRVKSDQPAYVPLLRKELQDFQNPPFFLFDGALLLLTVSNTPEDRKVALGAIEHCDLRDVERAEYFRQVHQFATFGENTTAAAFRTLDDPKFQVFIPQHALTLGQDYSLVYMLLPTDPAFWTAPAIARLATEKNETAQKSLLLLLWYAQTAEADQAIAKFAAGDATARSYAQALMKRTGGPATSLTEAALRERRRERMKAVSDEALIDLDNDTLLLLAKRK